MKFKEWLLSEIFNSPNPIAWQKTSNTDWVGTFDINGKKYFIKMIRDIGMPWEITFELLQGKKLTQNITGTGDANLVFSTVLNGIKQWMSSAKPDAFVLSAREPNRQSLYRRMLKMLPKNWQVEDLGTTFFVSDANSKQNAYAGFSDNDFADYWDD